jgi:hypothetical protein
MPTVAFLKIYGRTAAPDWFFRGNVTDFPPLRKVWHPISAFLGPARPRYFSVNLKKTPDSIDFTDALL